MIQKSKCESHIVEEKYPIIFRYVSYYLKLNTTKFVTLKSQKVPQTLVSKSEILYLNFQIVCCYFAFDVQQSRCSCGFASESPQSPLWSNPMCYHQASLNGNLQTWVKRSLFQHVWHFQMSSLDEYKDRTYVH